MNILVIIQCQEYVPKWWEIEIWYFVIMKLSISMIALWQEYIKNMIKTGLDILLLSVYHIINHITVDHQWHSSLLFFLVILQILFTTYIIVFSIYHREHQIIVQLGGVAGNAALCDIARCHTMDLRQNSTLFFGVAAFCRTKTGNFRRQTLLPLVLFYFFCCVSPLYNRF